MLRSILIALCCFVSTSALAQTQAQQDSHDQAVWAEFYFEQDEIILYIAEAYASTAYDEVMAYSTSDFLLALVQYYGPNYTTSFEYGQATVMIDTAINYYGDGVEITYGEKVGEWSVQEYKDFAQGKMSAGDDEWSAENYALAAEYYDEAAMYYVLGRAKITTATQLFDDSVEIFSDAMDYMVDYVENWVPPPM